MLRIHARQFFFTSLCILFLTTQVLFPSNAKKEYKETVEDLEAQLQSDPLSNNLSDKERLAVLFRLIDRLPLQAMDKSIHYCNQSIELAGQLNDIPSKARALDKLATLHMTRGDLDKAAGIYEEALKLFQQLADKKGIADSYNKLGMLYVNRDYQNIAQSYLLKSLKLREELGEKNPLYSSNLFLGVFYYSLDNYTKAMEFFKRAKLLAQQLNDNQKIMSCSYYTGVCLLKLNQPENALLHLKQTLTLAQRQDSVFYSAAALNWIGNIHGLQGLHLTALEELSTAREIQEKYGFKGKLIYNYLFTGNIYQSMGQIEKAAHFFDLTLELAKELKDKQTEQQVFKEYAFMFSQSGEYKKALFFYKKHAKSRELLLDETRMKQISELELQFESEKRLKEIELLTREGKKKQITRNTTLAVLFLILVILVLIFKKYLYLLAFWKTHKHIAQYRIISTIGSGGMGTVYLAHPVNDKQQQVAVKALREELIEDDISRRRFKHEGAIIDQLEHPNIVKIFERGEFAGKLYLVMEYLEGTTLAQIIKEEPPLKTNVCLPIMIQIASAVMFIHEKKVVHRDIKPANIMLLPGTGSQYLVKLLDFGVALAQSQTRLTQSGLLVGTINYLAPEQITENLYTAAGDIYALGVTFYEMITGTSPFPGESVTIVIEKILDNLPPELLTLPGIPGDLSRLILQMMDKTPQRRPSAAQVLNTLNRIKRV